MCDGRFDPRSCARLGITKFMEQGGLVKLQTVRDAKGNLENVYVKVCLYWHLFYILLIVYPRLTAKTSFGMAVKSWESFSVNCKYARAWRMDLVRGHSIRTLRRHPRNG